MAKKHTKIAIVYDFDGTLAPGNMQEHSFFPELGIKSEEFWGAVKQLAKKEDMDEILAYMFLTLKEAAGAGKSISRSSFVKRGKDTPLFSGVESWFKRINTWAKENKVTLEHFIVSSGLKEMIEGTKISKKFKHIFASTFLYDTDHIAKAPAVAINYTTKTQCLFRISKGIFNFYDNKTINQFIPPTERNIQFHHMIYIGDGETDIPCMKLLRSYGGYSIAVYNKEKRGQKKANSKLLKDGRADFLLPADYSENSDIDITIKNIIKKIVLEDTLKSNKAEILKNKKTPTRNKEQTVNGETNKNE